MADQQILVKATPMLAVVGYMDEKLGPDVRERILAKLAGDYPEPVRKVREKSVLAFDMVPLAFANAMMEATAAELKKPVEEVALEVGRRGAEQASKGVLRLVMAVISMQSLLQKLVPVWSQLYSHGKMTSTCGDRNARIELHDFPMASSAHCARVTGWFEWFARRAEKTARIRHATCRARGDALCTWDVTW